MIPETFISNDLLPDIFALLMGLAMLMYAILDGYDLGVGMLLPLDNQSHRDTMIASIGPFWDANETWLVLAVGLLLIAFPKAHSLVLGALYLPIVVMLIGLIIRGVAFDFRAKVRQGRKRQWDIAFKCGSFLASASQGFMLGLYIMGFDVSVGAYLFALLSALGVMAAYILIGACWLLMKTEHALQMQSLLWAKKALLLSGIGIVLVCIVNPLVNPVILDKWLTDSGLVMLAIIPTLSFGCLLYIWGSIQSANVLQSPFCAKPFIFSVALFLLCFIGLGFSFYPFVVPGQLTITETASAPESLRFILLGALVVMPCILVYTAFSYRVFRGKVTALKYY